MIPPAWVAHGIAFVRRWWWVALAVALGVFLGLATPPACGPRSVVEQSKTVEQVKTETQVETKAKVETTEKKVVIVRRDRVREAGGKLIDKSVIVETTDKATAAQLVEQAKQVEVREVVVEKRVEVKVSRDWRVSALVGLQPKLLPTFEPGPVVFGASVERRIAGPVFVGAWGLSNGTIGISASVEF